VHDGDAQRCRWRMRRDDQKEQNDEKISQRQAIIGTELLKNAADKIHLNSLSLKESTTTTKAIFRARAQKIFLILANQVF
jgi:hypothetical protein